MGLDATARESNVRDSYKKYFIDNIKKVSNIELVFDAGLSTPKIHGQKNEIKKWVSITMGSKTRGTLSEMTLDLHCCIRSDSEGHGLSQLGDTVMNYLVDTTKTDGMRRIPFYQSKAGGFSGWTDIGAMLITDIIESGDIEGPDNTKFKTFTVTIKWASKI